MSSHRQHRFDYTAGSVLTKKLYEYLRFPVLTPGRSPKDLCSFPVPHVYFFYAIVGSNETLLEELRRIAPEYVEAMRYCTAYLLNIHCSTLPKHRREAVHAKEMAVVLHKHYSNYAWQDQIPKAVYRGSCYPTANPDADHPDKYLFMRGGLCETVSKSGLNSKLFDIGMLGGGRVHFVCPCNTACLSTNRHNH